MIIKDILNALEAFAAPELQEDYDNAGLITGNAAWDCKSVLCTLDVTPAVVKEAIEKQCNLIVAHHPIVFRELKNINEKNYIGQVIIEAIKNDIAIYACHTNLDNIIMGVSAKMAEQLGLKNCKVLSPKNKILRRLITFAPNKNAEEIRKAIFEAGAGTIG